MVIPPQLLESDLQGLSAQAGTRPRLECPIATIGYDLDLQDFEKFMEYTRALRSSQVIMGVVGLHRCCFLRFVLLLVPFGIGRVLHMFEDDAGRDVGSEAAASPIILASLHISGCNMLLAMPIMSPQCSWTRVMLCALIAFVKFQESEIYVVVPSVTQTRLHAFGAVHVCDPLHNTRHSGASSVMDGYVGRRVSKQRISS